MNTLRFTLSKFQIYNIQIYSIVLTIVAMPYIISLELISFIIGCLSFFTFFTHFAYSPSPTSGTHKFVLCIFEFDFSLLDFIYK